MKHKKAVVIPKGRLTESMQAEIDRLVATVAIAQQQLNQFIAFCRAELKCPPDWVLHYQEKTFLPPEDSRFGGRRPEEVKVVR